MSQLSHRGAAWATGLTVFAVVMMMIAGIMQILTGIVALANDEFYVVGRDYTWKFDITTWGWIHLLIGILLVIVGACLWTGQTWARWAGLAIVGLSMIANFAWVPYYPVWGIIVLALDAAVIWALAVGTQETVE